MTSNSSMDQLTRFLFDEHEIRGEFCQLQTAFADATQHQTLPGPAKTLLGEFLTATSLLAGVLKFEGTLTLQVRGNGPIPLIMAESTDNKHIRGIVKPQANMDASRLEHLSFRDCIGEGMLTLTMDPLEGQRYQGIVPLNGETLSDCLAHYFKQSEQLPTKIWLFSHESQCAGLMLQSLPGQTDDEAQIDAWRTAIALADTLSAEESFLLDHHTLITRLFHEFTVRVYPSQHIQFACSCSSQRSARALYSIGENEAFALLAERGEIEIQCEFCGQEYRYGAQNLRELFGKADDQLH